MHVEGRWDDNVYTVEGKHGHRRVDQLDHVLPDPDTSPDEGPASSRPTDTDEPPQVSRSVSLASESLGLTAKLDLVSTAGSEGRSRRDETRARPEEPGAIVGARARSADGVESTDPVTFVAVAASSHLRPASHGWTPRARFGRSDNAGVSSILTFPVRLPRRVCVT
jgi:hypothetical protein